MTAITKVDNTAIINVEYFSDDVIQAFVASRHGSANSARTYKNAVKRLVKFFAVNKIAAPTTADVDSFINTLRAESKSASTIRLYNTVTKMFFAFLEKNRIYRNVAADCEPLKLRKSSTHAKNALTQNQAQMLLKSIAGDSVIALRDKAIVALCLQCGLRTVEVERANVEDLTDAGDYYTLAVMGKGHESKDQTVKVARPVATLIYKYLAARGQVDKDNLTSKNKETPLFTSTARNSSNGKRLSAQSVGKMIKARMKAIGINSKAITAHSTRHFAATCAIKAGVDLREVSAMLRHSSINVTMTYLHDISLETRRAELAVADSLFGGVA